MVIILFSQYLAGHHLANLIGLTNNVSYMNEQEIHNHYLNSKSRTAHLYHDKIFIKDLSFSADSPIGISHFGAFEYVCLDSKQFPLDDKQIIVIRMPDSDNHLSIKRMHDAKYSLDITEHRALYKQSTIEKLCPTAKVNEISSENIFTRDLNALNNELDYFDCSIDLKYQYLHDLWCNKNKI